MSNKKEQNENPKSKVYSLFHGRHFPSQKALEDFNREYFAKKDAKSSKVDDLDANTTVPEEKKKSKAEKSETIGKE